MTGALIKKKEHLSIFTIVALIFTILFSSTPLAGAAPVLSDLEGHWAQSAIQDMVKEGIIGGYPDGTFKPNNNITRAEFASLMVRAFALEPGPGKVFGDTADHWARDAIGTANYHGLVSGYSDSIFGPDDPVTREQIAVMIVKATKAEPTESGKAFTDSAQIAAWAEGTVAKATAAGLITGYPDGTFRPKANATRAEAAVILARCMTLIEEEVLATIYDSAGIYGPESGTQTIAGDVIISADGVILQNIIIKGNLTISEEVGSGDVTLNNVTVEGTTIIRGGGKDSIHINGGQYNNIIIESTPDGNVRVVAINVEGLKVIISENAAGEEVILEGTFDSVEIRADNVVLSTQGETTIDEITVHENITGTILNIEENTKVEELILDSETKVNNAEGTVENISGAKASDSNITNPPKDEALPVGGGGGGGETVTRYTLTVQANPPEGGNVTGGGSYRSGAIVPVTATANEEYVFVNWTVDGKEVSTAASFQYKMPSKNTTLVANFKREVSLYAFSYQVPSGVVAGAEVAVPVTFATVEVGDIGYEGVRFKFAATGPDEANVTFKATDSKGVEHTFTNEGYWGPAEGFALPADYTATTNWKVTFDKAGDYTITFELVNLEDNEVIAQGSETITVIGSEPTEPAITMTAGDATIEDGKVTLSVTTKNTGADYAGARYGIKVNVAGVEGDTISVSYGEGLTFNLTRVDGSDDFIGYFGPADGFTIEAGWNVTTTFTVDFGTSAKERTVTVDAWVGQAPTPSEEDAVATMDQVEITIPATELEEYHTYKFNIEGLADEYVVSEGLENPTDADFEGMTPVKLSIVVDETKDKAYEGKVRVAPVGADNLLLWAKDTEGNWYDINVVGWGPGEGFPIDTTLVTDVYVVATAAFDGNVTLKLVDVTGDYGAVDNIIISQEVAVKAVAAPVPSTYKFSYTVPEEVIAGEEYIVPVTIEPQTVGDYGYDSVRFNVDVTTPEEATLQLLATDTNGVEHNVAEIGYWGPLSGFPIGNDYSATTDFTAIFSAAGEYTITFSLVDLSGEEPVALVTETVEITAKDAEYHTYKFNIEDLADKYIVSEGLENPTDTDFEGMTPVKLSIVVDETKDKAYEGKVRVAPVGAEGLQLWGKDTEGNWYDINQVGWGPAAGFPIDTTLVTDVYVVATKTFDGNVNLKLVDVDQAYGAEDNIIISQDVAVKAEVESEEPEKANLVAKNSFGIHENKVYAGYELQDEDGNQIRLIESNIESITVLEPNATEPKALTVVGDDDPLLWFNIAKAAGKYTYTIVTKGDDSKTYKADLEWAEPAKAAVSFQAPVGASDVFTAATDNTPAQVDFSKVTADKLLDWTSVKDNYYAIELKIEGVDLSEGNVKYAFRVYEDVTAIEPEIKGDLDTQYVTTDWKLGTATMYYVLTDNSLHQAVINVVSLTPKTEEEPTKSEYGFELTGTGQEFVAGDLLEGSVIVGADGVNTEGLTPVGVTLKAITVNELGYDNVKVLAPEVTQTEGSGGKLQFWAYSADDGKWFDAAVHGWGSGFAITPDYDVTTNIYVFADTAGTYTVTFKLVDLDNESAVIAEKTETIKVVEALPEQSTYKLTYTDLAESYTVGEFVTGETQAEINTAVEAAIIGLEPVKVTLATDVLGQTGYDAVRILPVNAGDNIQLWAKDTSNNWYDIKV